MVFTSIEYVVLLALTAFLFWTLPPAASMVVLLGASVAFYASWSLPALGLVAASIGVGYLAALRLDRSGGAPRPRWPVWLACLSLLGSLGYFKYADLGLELWNAIQGIDFEPLGIVLPLAISFYTFQILGYVIDVYRGAPAERSPLRFSLFVSFFPQLIAGPIVRRDELLPQLGRRGRFRSERFLSGLELIAFGAVKKLVFADNLAPFVDRVYAEPAASGGLDVVIATIAFGAQIYCDFSGYTDIARGSARLFDIELPVNFRWPYLSRSLGEFWRRWHITLSSWLRDYLYIPLGGGRRAPGRVYLNLLITMTLGGLWHGASLTFLVWGAYHGAILAAERALGFGPRSGRGSGVLAWLWTFLVVQIGWAFFRAESFEGLQRLVSAIASSPFSVRLEETSAAAALALTVYIFHGASAWVGQRPGVRVALRNPIGAGVFLAVCLCLAVVFGGTSDGFIYFQF